MLRLSDDAVIQIKRAWSPDDGAAARPSGPGRTRGAGRLAQRNAAIRAALPLFGDGTPFRAAKDLQRDLRDYLARCWPRERQAETLPTGTGERRAALHRIARLNGGRDLCWRRIYDILSIGQARP
jgi:hypothetical protein